MDIVGEQRKRLLLRHGALVRLDAAHAPLARVVEIVEQQLVKAHLAAFRDDIGHILARGLLFGREPVRAVRIVPDKARQLAHGGVRHVLVGVQAVVQRADAADRIVVRVDKALNGRVRCAVPGHRAAVDRALHFGIIVELAARVLELDRHGVHVLIKAIECCLPIAAERVRTQLDCVGILDDGLLHRDLKVVLLLIVAAVAAICGVVLWGLLYPGELKADRAVRIVYHIALRKQKAARQQQNDHQHHGQHASAAPAPAITGIALRSARSSCHCLHPPPFSRATVYLLRAKKSTKTFRFLLIFRFCML